MPPLSLSPSLSKFDLSAKVWQHQQQQQQPTATRIMLIKLRARSQSRRHMPATASCRRAFVRVQTRSYCCSLPRRHSLPLRISTHTHTLTHWQWHTQSPFVVVALFIWLRRRRNICCCCGALFCFVCRFAAVYLLPMCVRERATVSAIECVCVRVRESISVCCSCCAVFLVVVCYYCLFLLLPILILSRECASFSLCVCVCAYLLLCCCLSLRQFLFCVCCTLSLPHTHTHTHVSYWDAPSSFYLPFWRVCFVVLPLFRLHSLSFWLSLLLLSFSFDICCAPVPCRLWISTKTQTKRWQHRQQIQLNLTPDTLSLASFSLSSLSAPSLSLSHFLPPFLSLLLCSFFALSAGGTKTCRRLCRCRLTALSALALTRLAPCPASLLCPLLLPPLAHS